MFYISVFFNKAQVMVIIFTSLNFITISAVWGGVICEFNLHNSLLEENKFHLHLVCASSKICMHLSVYAGHV
jgi:hypothetical protein